MASRLSVLFAGLVISFVSAYSLSKVEQGYFFTFLSLAATQTLFELGITNLILHHLSHGRAGISSAIGEDALERARIEVRVTRAYALKYFRRAAYFFFVSVGAGGTIFFYMSDYSHNVLWQIPWGAMVAATALGLFNLSFLSYLEGFGQLNTSYRIRITSTILLLFVFSILSNIFGGLLAYPCAYLLSNGYAFLALRRASQGIDLEHGLKGHTPIHQLEIGPDQRRMGLSAVAGYITANSLTLYTFHYFGAETAGQFGLTMSVFSALATMAMARTTAEAPTYGPLIAGGNLDILMMRFRRTLRFTFILATLSCLGALVLRELGLFFFPSFSNRMMGLSGFLAMGLLVVSNVLLSVTSTVLRAFRTEKLMWPSIIAALIVLASQLTLHLDPVYCVTLLAAFNGLVFYPYAHKLLMAQISISRHAK